METFGTRLKKLRNERGITQEKLARDLDIPESSIRRLEISKGVPRMERLNQIAAYFNESTDFLLGRDTKKELHNEEDFIESDDQDKIIFDLVKKVKNPEFKKGFIDMLNGLTKEK